MARKAAKKKKTSITKKKVTGPKTKRKAAVKRKTKSKKVLAVPKGYNSIIPYLIVNQADKAIEFYKKCFGAKEMLRSENEGKVKHAELKIGEAKIMLAEENAEMDARGPRAFGGSPVSIHFYTKKVDDVVDGAVKGGAKLVRPVENMFYGDRSGTIEDPFGHIWHVSTHIEDVSKAELKKRMAKLFNKANLK